MDIFFGSARPAHSWYTWAFSLVTRIGNDTCWSWAFLVCGIPSNLVAKRYSNDILRDFPVNLRWDMIYGLLINKLPKRRTVKYWFKSPGKSQVMTRSHLKLPDLRVGGLKNDILLIFNFFWWNWVMSRCFALIRSIFKYENIFHDLNNIQLFLKIRKEQHKQ